jgi:hypothetical protein
MKNHLRSYVRYAQNDWINYLSNAKFVANNYFNVSIEMTFFFVDHEYNSRSKAKSSNQYYENRKLKIQKADDIIKRQQNMTQWLRKNIAWAQAEQIQHVNKERQSHSEYKVDDLIYVNVKDFSFERSSKSLTFKNVESWKIIKVIDNKAYEFKLFDHLKAVELISIFHSWNLHWASNDSFSDQVSASESSILIIDNQIKEIHEEYEILEIVNCRHISKHDLQYKVIYVENWDQWNVDSSWQSASDFENAQNQISRFHQQNSAKSKQAN